MSDGVDCCKYGAMKLVVHQALDPACLKKKILLRLVFDLIVGR